MTLSSIFKPMSVVEDADGLLKDAEDLFEEHQSAIRRPRDRILAEDCIRNAKNHRYGIEKKGLLDQADQAKLYSESAKQALDTVTGIVERALEI
ncbi:hypothetical protein BJV77DRAFT_1041132 [Russula vinacea]|nr:hypothetical protein BJV77DRAFT_1041132 [Russula vinacea]